MKFIRFSIIAFVMMFSFQFAKAQSINVSAHFGRPYYGEFTQEDTTGALLIMAAMFIMAGPTIIHGAIIMHRHIITGITGLLDLITGTGKIKRNKQEASGNGGFLFNHDWQHHVPFQ